MAAADSRRARRADRPRHSEFHDTLYQLEPDVKDGPGALRDVWATRMMLRLGGDRRRVERGPSPDRLSDAEEFLMRIRSGLHVDTGRNVNVLSYELQEKAVDRLRYSGLSSLSGQAAEAGDMRRRVEALMTDYFKDARSVTRALGRVRRAALPPCPTPIRLIGENLMWVVEGITFADPARGGRRSGRMAAGVRGRGLAQRARRRRRARAHRARAATAPLRAGSVSSDARASAPHPAVHAAACRAVGAAQRDARLRPARRDLPRAERDRLPRDARLLSQVHRRRAHAADRAERRAPAHQPAVRADPARSARARAAGAVAAVSRRRQSTRR